jgi:hypothetical protein
MKAMLFLEVFARGPSITAHDNNESNASVISSIA